MILMPVAAVVTTHMAPLDWAAIAIYFALLIGVATWVVRKNMNTADDYFLAGRNLGWWVVGASIFASNIGSEHCRSAAACPPLPQASCFT